MPSHGHRVFIDVPVPRAITPPLPYRPRSPRTPPRSPRHYRRHSLSLEEPSTYVFRDDVNMYQEREDNNLRAAKESLLRHNLALTSQLKSKNKTIQEQQDLIEQLERENHELRRSLDTSSEDSRRETKIRDLKKKNARLEADNEKLTTRLREAIRLAKDAADDRVRLLRDEVSSLTSQISEWRRRYDDADRRLKRLRENMDDHIDANRKLTTENNRLANENELLRREVEQNDGIPVPVVRRRYGR